MKYCFKKPNIYKLKKSRNYRLLTRDSHTSPQFPMHQITALKCQQIKNKVKEMKARLQTKLAIKLL